MRSPEIVLTVKKQFTMIGKILAVDNGVHLHHLILEIFVLSLKGQKIDFMGTILHNVAVSPDRRGRAVLEVFRF